MMPRARCTEVVDGDTFYAHDGERIRLANVNTPDRGEPGYEQAKNQLARLVLNKIVDYQVVARDPWGRAVSEVWVDNMSVNQAMRDLGYS